MATEENNVARLDNFLVVGVVRDCARHLKADVSRIAKALGKADKIQWLLIESDSSDHSVAVLSELEASTKYFRYVSLGKLRDEMPLRTDRIAFCRNEYLKQIKQKSIYKDVEWVLVSDFDGANSLISKESLSSCWSRVDWDVCAANQQGPYYDLWALRHREWCPDDCWAQYEFLKRYMANKEKALDVAVHAKMITIPRQSDWIEVDSAFGGSAIYRKRIMERGTYIGKREDGSELCEHVSFHESLKRAGARIFINPEFVNTGLTVHSEYLVRKRIIRQLKGAIKSALMKIVGHHLYEQIKTRLKELPERSHSG